MGFSGGCEVGCYESCFSCMEPHFSQTFIIRGRVMTTWAQTNSPPHWQVPTDFRAAPWRATFCTLLSAISSRSLLLLLQLHRGPPAPTSLIPVRPERIAAGPQNLGIVSGQGESDKKNSCGSLSGSARSWRRARWQPSRTAAPSRVPFPTARAPAAASLPPAAEAAAAPFRRRNRPAGRTPIRIAFP